MDYREWPGDSDSQESSTSWGTGTPRVPDSRSSGTFADGTRPRYSDREYTNHGYWDEQQQSERRYPTPPPRTDSWPGAGQSTGSWRLEPLPAVPQPAVPQPGPAPIPDGFAAPAGFDGTDRDYPAVLWWTVIWFAVPVVVYTLWAVIMSASSMRGHALHALLGDALPGLVALGISLGFATWIRRISLDWRAITLGFGAAAVGAGVTTLLISIL